VFTARYALSPYMKQTIFAFKGLMIIFLSPRINSNHSDNIFESKGKQQSF